MIRIVRVLKCKIKRMEVVASPELNAAEIAEAETLGDSSASNTK